ncbi:DUF1279 super [Malassezia cuniculi]|uniref:DUF1279 super n=1 Tax=Malassezia cuniculi TaxID=948313 RepID=A0AAF0ES80_9BASI|nr:DUF1279 super [Malassezia cuniculi]
MGAAAHTYTPLIARSSVVRAPVALHPAVQMMRFQSTVPPKPDHVAPAADTTTSAPRATQAGPQEGGANQEPPKKPSFMERFRTIMRNYGWWALGVYMIMSGIDLTFAFICVHFAGGEHIKELEHKARKIFGVSKKEVKEASGPDDSDLKTFLRFLAKDKETEELIAQLTTEFIIAFGIHKTLFLPVRAGITAAITPRLVRWLIRKGWARPPRTAAVAAATGAAAAATTASK